MRVIEPRQFKSNKAKKKPTKLKSVATILLAVVILGGLYLVFTQKTAKAPSSVADLQNANSQSAVNQPAKPTKLKTFNSEEFRKLYNSFAYPNTQKLLERPPITGDKEADERIYKVAESRGYTLSAVPVASIVKTGEPDLIGDDLIQPNALIAWQELKAAALKEGIKLQMTSAYRSIDFQRDLFIRRMKDDFVYTESVAAGYVDPLVEKVLMRAAPPGYSRHHTGYTMDLSCDGIGGESFKTTSCYSWLSENNYENTKKFGWVPSYTEGADQQGPEPEAWEFIWVSTYSLYE